MITEKTLCMVEFDTRNLLYISIPLVLILDPKQIFVLDFVCLCVFSTLIYFLKYEISKGLFFFSWLNVLEGQVRNLFSS